MFILRLSLMLVVFVDVMGQGLILPIINTLLIEPSSGFLHPGTTGDTREMLYGSLIGIFYVFWFFGAAYISKVSDYIGRKKGMVICLVGALAGYILTVIAIEASNYYLLLLSRAISGFTAGNQPIAQAALVDISRTDLERTENMGRVVAASALGLVAGPLIAGLLSDTAVVGRYATLELPFICAAVLVFLTLSLVLVFFHDARMEHRRIDFGISEVFINLLRIRRYPTIMKISVVFFFAELGLNSFFIYLDDYMIERFRFDTLQNSIILTVFGLTMAISSGVLVGPLSARFRKIPTVTYAIIIMAVALVIFTLNGNPLLSYFYVVPIVIAFAICYPTMLSLFSESANADEQGWVMGITIALFTLGPGLISLAGGAMMAIDAVLPFITGVASFLVALIFIATLWRHADVRSLETAVIGKS
jgi:DHA1 family tetracycline resistance protein-like MFS transporter